MAAAREIATAKDHQYVDCRTHAELPTARALHRLKLYCEEVANRITDKEDDFSAFTSAQKRDQHQEVDAKEDDICIAPRPIVKYASAIDVGYYLPHKPDAK